MQTFPPSSADTYKALARTWAATVNVVTTRRAPSASASTPAGESDPPELDGFTATAFVTVSIAPPIILVCATRAGTPFAMLRDASSFVVNLLAPTQMDVANAFARPLPERVALWKQIAWTPDADGAPLLAGTVGAFSCRVRQLVDAGDHVVVLGDVTELHVGEGTDTLVYHNRGYGRVTRD